MWPRLCHAGSGPLARAVAARKVKSTLTPQWQACSQQQPRALGCLIKYDIGVKQGDTLAPVLFLCYIQAVLETLFPKFEAAGIEKLMFRSMQPLEACCGR